MDSPSLPEPEPLRRSTRNFNKVEPEEKNSKYEPDSFSDPRKRILDPELLERLNDFLWDIGTDPDQIDVNFPDLSGSSNQARVFYVPRLEEDIDQSVVPENKDTSMNPQENVHADVKPETAPTEFNLAATNDQNEVDDGFGASVESISPENVERVNVEDDRNERQIIREPLGMRARNMLSNCIAS